jgi:hypothetical protein
MHGLLLLVTFVAMLPQGDVLPAPMTGFSANAPVLPNTNPNLMNSDLTPPPSSFPMAGPSVGGQGTLNPPEPYKVGWGTDPQGAFSLILQISPDAVDNFAKGDKGSELAVDIPPEIQGMAQRIIVRIGSGPVERIPANPRSLSRSGIGEGPTIANAFDMRPLESSNNGTPVTIDRAPSRPVSMNVSPAQDVLPDSNTNNLLPNRPNPSLPLPNLPGAGNSNSRPASLPSQLATDNFTPVVTPSSGNAGVVPNNTPNNYATSNNPNLGLPNRNTASPYVASNPNGANSVPPFGQGEFNNSTNNAGLGQNSSLNSPSPFPPFNPTQPYSQSQVPLGMQSQQQQQPPLYAQNPYTTPPPAYSQGPSGMLASARQRNPGMGLETDELPPAVTPGWNAWLPFTLLLSIVINVYQGMWMGHLRARYRQLLGDMRGVPVSEYAGG